MEPHPNTVTSTGPHHVTGIDPAGLVERPNLNKDLLIRTMDHIRKHPEQWEQSVWRDTTEFGCGTQACLAGWAAELGSPPEYFGFQHSDDIIVTPLPEELAFDKNTVTIRQRAAYLLGLDPPAADHTSYSGTSATLFGANNTMQDLEVLVYDLLHDRPLPSIDLDFEEDNPGERYTYPVAGMTAVLP